MAKQIQDAYIVAARRTPVGKAPRGMFRNVRPDELLAHALRATLAELPLLEPSAIDDVVAGCAIPEAEQGMNVARVALLLAGLPNTVAGMTVNRFCSSGLQAVAIAADRMGFSEAAASIIKPTAESRKVLRRALEAEKASAPYIMGDGYYAFINCARYIEAGGLQNSEQLLAHLGEKFGVAVVPGMYFSDAGLNWIRFSYALPPEVTDKAVQRLFEGLKALL